MREPISLKEILAIVIKRGKGILCFAVAFAVMLAGWKLSGRLQEVKLPQNAPQQLEAAYQQALADYEDAKELLEKKIDGAMDSLRLQEQYMEESPLMALDANETTKCTTVFVITDSDHTGRSYSDSSADYAYMITAIQNYYLLNWDTTDLQAALSADIEDIYLRELIGLELLGSGAMRLTVFGDTEEAAQALAKAAEDYLLNLQNSLGEKTYPHAITVFSRLTETGKEEHIAAAQEHAEQKLAECEEQLKALKAEQDALAAPVMQSAFTTRGIVISAVKWAIIGGVLGLFLGCAWVLLMFLFRARAESSRQLEQVLGIPFLGSAVGKAGLWQRLGSWVMGERQWKNADDAQAFLSENLKTVLPNDGSVAILSSLPGGKIGKDLCRVQEIAGKTCEKAVVAADAESAAAAVAALRECRYLVLAERIGASDVPKMLSVLEIAKRTGICVVGFITI